jgi:hypothetical protein
MPAFALPARLFGRIAGIVCNRSKVAFLIALKSRMEN